jgi:hypothetical protein
VIAETRPSNPFIARHLSDSKYFKGLRLLQAIIYCINVCNDGMLVQLLAFWTLAIILLFIEKQAMLKRDPKLKDTEALSQIYP